MTDKTLEQRAREAADRRNMDSRHPTSAETPHGAYMSGYLAAARKAEQEIAALQVELVELRSELAEAKASAKATLEVAVRVGGEQLKEIATLRARVAELERMVPRWVLENESALLNEQGWSVSETDKLGNGPRLWLMVPPIPLPEGEG